MLLILRIWVSIFIMSFNLLMIFELNDIWYVFVIFFVELFLRYIDLENYRIF